LSHPVPPPLPAEPPRPPVRAIRWYEVVLGFFGGLSLAWGLRILLWYAVGQRGGLLFALGAPTAALIFAVVWASRTGRRGLAVGMSIYLGVGILLGLLVVGAGVFTLFRYCAAMNG